MSLIISAAIFVGGVFVGAGGWAAFEAKAKAELAVLVADIKAEAAKIAPTATALLSKIEALLSKL